LKYDGTRAETRFRLSAKRTSLFKSAGASVQSTTGSRGVRFSGSNAGYTMFRGSVKSTSYPLHSPVSPSLPLPCVIACHHIASGLLILLFHCNSGSTNAPEYCVLRMLLVLVNTILCFSLSYHFSIRLQSLPDWHSICVLRIRRKYTYCHLRMFCTVELG